MYLNLINCEIYNSVSKLCVDKKKGIETVIIKLTFLIF